MVKIQWSTYLDGDAQKLVTLADNEDALELDAKTIAEQIEHWTVVSVRETLTQFDDELARLEQMKEAIISAKRQIKGTILKGIQ